MIVCLLSLAALALAIHAVAVDDTQARRELPDDGTITLTDYGYRDWGPEAVHYALKRAVPPGGNYALLDGDGKAVPFQLDGNTLTFIGAVKRGGTATYRFQMSDRDRSGDNSTLAVARRDEMIEVKNEFLALRLPAPATREFAEPIDAARATPPLAQWAGADGAWMGGARLVTARKVRAQSFAIIRNGPAAFEYEARYRFAPRGEYVLRVQLAPGRPLATVTEEFDFGEITSGEDVLVLELHKGWQPRGIGVIKGANEQQHNTLDSAPYQAYVDAKRKATQQAAPVGGVGAAPAPFMPGANLVLLEQHVPGGRWGAMRGGQQVWDGETPGAGRSIGIVPLHVGAWRHAMALDTWYQEGVGVLVALPISVRLNRWSLEVTDDLSPFSTHEHDEGLAFTYGRREWGLYAGPEMNMAQARYGHIGLDRYKDWIVDWPEDPQKASYPGGFFSRAHIERLRKTLDQHPDGAFLKNWYLFSGSADDAVKHAQRVIGGLKAPYQENDFFLGGLSNYRKSQFLIFANYAEDALACPDLPKDIRAELRRRIALYAYVMSDPDVNPRGAGCHLGNNNMTINRTLALTYFGGLLPDHPRYAYWMDRAKAAAQFKLASQTTPDGAFIECPSYQLYSPYRTLNISLNILRNRGIAPLAESGYPANTLRYLSNLTMPDPRWKGARIIPGMGNSSNQLENFWGFSMATVADHSPEFAGWLRFMNRLAVGDRPFEKGPNAHDGATPHALYYLPDIPEKPAALTTAFFPGYGVMFRAHFNTPGETAMLLRAGINWSHWDTDALNAILYGKAAPLSPGTGYQYYGGPMMDDNAIYHNRVKVGQYDAQEVFGRVDGTVADHGFGPSADYAVASRYYPRQIFADGNGDVRWNRHILFLKSDAPDGPSYFVMRDTFPGTPRPNWWTWMNLEGAERISVDGAAFPAQPVNKTAAPDAMPTKRGQAVEMGTDYGASTWFWFADPRDVRIRLVADYNRQDGLPGKETKTIVEALGAPEQDFFYAVYPKSALETPPQCTALGPGAMKIVTRESTDYVFISDAPMTYNKDGVVFTGKAGAVRIFRDRVALCLNAGSGTVGYNGHILEGHGPFEQTIPVRALRRGTTKITAAPAGETMTVTLPNGITITGEGPFSAQLDGEAIRIQTPAGRARVLHVAQPTHPTLLAPLMIRRPQYWVDGTEWMACWTDYPASGWGSYDNSWLIALSVPAGKHDLLVQELRFPTGWTRPFTPLIEGVTRAGTP